MYKRRMCAVSGYMISILNGKAEVYFIFIKLHAMFGPYTLFVSLRSEAAYNCPLLAHSAVGGWPPPVPLGFG